MLVAIWSVFDFIIDYKNVWVFITLRAIYTPVALYIAFNFHKPVFKVNHHLWAHLHYIFLIIDIGLMVLWTDHFIKYLIGFSTIFWFASVIMVWRFWNTVVPGIICIAIGFLRFTLFPHNVSFGDLITGLYFFSTCLACTLVISAYVYHSAYQLTLSKINLRKTQEKLVQSEKMQSLNLIVASVAHELNNPLGAAITATTDAQSKIATVLENLTKEEITLDMLEDPSKDARHSLDISVHALGRVRSMIKRFKQTSVDHSESKPRTFSVSEYIREHIVNLALRNQIKQGNVSVTVHTTGNDNIVSYPGTISQIVSNLIINSIVHGFSGKHRGARHIDIHVGLVNQRFEIRHVDNGLGIEEKNIKRIFDPFFSTLKQCDKQLDSGAGLGLNIVYNLVTTVLEGQIDVTSKPLQGATFSITFPVELEVRESELTQNEHKAPGDKKHFAEPSSGLEGSTY